MKHDFSKYINPVFVETGSYKGKGIKKAIVAGFNEIHSIELSEHYHKHCVKKFSKYKRVHLYLGDSSKILKNVIRDIDKKITFWLDGHYSGPGTAIGTEAVPLMPELNQIKNHPINTHTIMIDDMRLLRNDNLEWAYLKYTEEDLISIIMNINNKYKISYKNTKYSKRDILIASVI